MIRSSASPVVHGNLGRGRSAMRLNATPCFATKPPFNRNDVTARKATGISIPTARLRRHYGYAET
ncbi:hypothetical protein R69927_00713 [Paraburkholderia domus]|uniref:Uncharacterized protein n=1 Tax=Paraburkholderia domus TaxID=2793075 RepID=A0A9N8MME9_9BURK|nr:hypothetical protein R70006_01232 [Paraburkholderia domus]CAE6822590.1 hypothetical protein R69927_00713 [Paraburkholderia domus]CAE6859546.1 hypothetical protein R70199_00794 [Paraburkholderia domus]CAE6869921.1 hypothetical protein R70211_01135 [Paraburkholderia domus]CAE6873562.1 hypothetical protein R69749_06438 [Paraburkholderia domus]